MLWIAAAFALAAGAGCTAQAKRARRLAKANEYFAAGDFAKAEIEYRNVQQIVPLDPDAISHLATIFFDQGRAGLAAAYLTKAHELQADNVEVSRRLASFYISSGKFKEARDLALSVLTRVPTDELAPLLVASVARTAPEMEEARRSLQAMPAANGAPILVALATLDMRQSKMADAEAKLHQAETLQPNSYQVALDLGAIYELKKDLPAAEKSFRKAAAVAPARTSAPLRCAEFLLRTNKADDAKKLLTETTTKTPDFLPAWLLLAQIAEFEKKPDDVLAIVSKKILALDGLHHDAWLLSARAHLAKGQSNEAQTELERLEKSYPKSPEVQYELGVTYAGKGETERAITALNQAIAVAPDAMGANLLLAGLYVRSGSPALAVKLLAPLVKKMPQAAQARLMLAQAHRAQGNLDAALKTYADMEKDFRPNPQTGFNEGMIYLQQKKIAEARQAFSKALEIAPGDVNVVEQLVNIDLSEKKFGPALERVDALIAKNAKVPELYLLRAKVLAANADRKAAEVALQRVVELSPDSPVGYYTLAQLYLAENDRDKAIANLQQAIAKNPKNPVPLIVLGSVLEQKKDFKGAYDSYEKALQLNPNSALVLNNLAYLDAEVFNQVDKGFERAQLAQKLAPASPDVEDTLGWIMYRKHDYARALTLLSESAEKKPTDADAQYHLGMAAYFAGAEEPAQAALRRAIGLKASAEWIAEANHALTTLALDPRTMGGATLRDLEKTAAERPDPVAQLRLGAYYEQSGAVDKAATAYEAARAANPGSVNAALGLIRIFMARNEPAKALELAKTARKLAPNDPEVGHVLGRLAYVAGDRVWALGLLQESIRKLSDDPRVLADFADAAYARGQISPAEDAFQGVLAAHPTAAQAAYAKDRLELIGLGKDPSAATAAFAKIDQHLKADPLDVAALMALALTQEKRADIGEAQKTYEKALSRFDDFPPAQRGLLLIFSRRSSVDPKAADLVASVRQVYPDDEFVAKAAGIIFYRQANYARALPLLQEAVRKLTSDAESYFYLGSTQNKLKDVPGCLRSLQRALELGLPADLASEAKQVLATNKK